MGKLIHEETYDKVTAEARRDSFVLYDERGTDIELGYDQLAVLRRLIGELEKHRPGHLAPAAELQTANVLEAIREFQTANRAGSTATEQQKRAARQRLLSLDLTLTLQNKDA